jgi:hypothetical protein
MSKRKWHDITPETGDPQDLPTNEGVPHLATMCSAYGNWTRELLWLDNTWWIGTGVDRREAFGVIAWREMPRAYVPGSRKAKPTRFAHECEVSDGQDMSSIKIANPDGSNIMASLDVWRTMADTMWGKDASQYVSLTKRGTTIPVRVTVEILASNADNAAS